MSDTRTVDPKLAQKANRSYWNSDDSVNQIAEDLGLSKSSLYGLIEQIETGLACPDCQSELVFANRTARDRGMVSCPACDFEGQGEQVLDLAEGGELPAPRWRGSRDGSLSSGRVLTGTVLLSVAAGLILASVLRRR